VRTKQFPVIAGAALLVATAVPLVAHHSFAAEFDVDKPVKIKGTVAIMEWKNPHSWIHIEVKDPNGTVELWMVEGTRTAHAAARVDRREPRADACCRLRRTHGFSDQYLVELPVFDACAREAGLRAGPRCQAKFPPSDLATVSLNNFTAGA
jgi:Family of unknown function (DUF6152)